MGLLFVSVQSNHRNSLFRQEAKQPKQTVAKQTVLKQTEKNEKNRKNRKNPKISVKNSKVCSLSNCFGWSSVCFGSIEKSKLSVSVQKRNNRNKRFVSDSAEISFGSTFGCFESKLVSKDTLGLQQGSRTGAVIAGTVTFYLIAESELEFIPDPVPEQDLGLDGT